MKSLSRTVNPDLSGRQSENAMFMLDGVRSDPRQRRKIVRGFEDPAALQRHDVALSEKEEEIFLHEIARRELNEREHVDLRFKRLIAMITGNILHLKCKPMYEAITGDQRLVEILRYFLPEEPLRGNTPDLAVLRFLERYPDVMEFQHEAARYLEHVSMAPDAGDHLEQRDAMRRFMEIIYGKQFEYLMQINLLRTEARAIYIREQQRLRTEMETLQLHVMEEPGRDEVFNLTETHGDPASPGFQVVEAIASAGLKPLFRVIFRGRTVAFFSPPYWAGSDRTAVIAYIPRKGRYIARSYYLSHAHAVWRFLDAYLPMAGKVAAYGKGGKHASVNLPLPFQRALAMLPHAAGKPAKPANGEQIFISLAKNALNTAEYAENGHYTDTWLPDAPPQKLFGNFYPLRGQRIPPQEIVFRDPGQVPDFSKHIASWESTNPAYGAIQFEAVLSMDDRLIYTYCRDSLNRRWIGNIENHSAIVSTGLRQVWVDGGDLTTPAFEYYSKSGGYGDYDLRWGLYVDMYKNYLSKIFFIQT